MSGLTFRLNSKNMTCDRIYARRCFSRDLKRRYPVFSCLYHCLAAHKNRTAHAACPLSCLLLPIRKRDILVSERPARHEILPILSRNSGNTAATALYSISLSPFISPPLSLNACLLYHIRTFVCKFIPPQNGR